MGNQVIGSLPAYQGHTGIKIGTMIMVEEIKSGKID